jgi:hypothetical protein
LPATGIPSRPESLPLSLATLPPAFTREPTRRFIPPSWPDGIESIWRVRFLGDLLSADVTPKRRLTRIAVLNDAPWKSHCHQPIRHQVAVKAGLEIRWGA